MVDWLKLVLIAAGVMVALWGLLVILAARLPPGLLKDLAGFLPACVTLVRRLRADPRVPWQAKAAVVVAGLPIRRSSSRGSPGQAFSSTSRGTRRAA